MATCLHPKSIYGKLYPCGKCPVCQQNKRQSLATRLMLESAFSASTKFVTLTYNEDSLPYCSNSVIFDDFTNRSYLSKKQSKILVDYIKSHSESKTIPDLPIDNDCFCIDDVQKFFKLVRKHFPIPFKYFVTSERGDNNNRCHYHLLLFFDKKVSNSQIYDLVQKYWNLGFISVSNASDARIAYCAKYCLKEENQISSDICKYDYRQYRRLFSQGLGESSIPFINEYIYNDGNYRYYFNYQGKNVIFDQYFKKHLDPSLIAELQNNVESKQNEIQQRLCDSRAQHSKYIFNDSCDSLQPDYSYDRKVYKHRFQLKQLKKHRLL